MPCTFNTENLTPDEYYDLVINRADWFLFHCRAGGFEFSIETNRLMVTPAHAIDDEMYCLLKQHKHNLIKLLESEAMK